MRKIYSILLIACSMLISANIQAQQKTVYLYKAGALVDKYATLQAAVNAVNAGETAKIVLEGDQELSVPVVIPQVGTSKTDEVASADKVANRAMQHITLDMNGYDIYASESYFGSMFILLKGDLNIIGEGTISRNDAATTNWAGSWSNFSKAAIVVCGADGERNPTADKPDRSKQEWSILTIGEKVTVAGLGHGLDNSNKVGCFGLAIQDITTTTGNGTYHPSLDEYVHYVNLGYSTYNKTSNVGPMWFRAAGSPAGEQGSAFGVKIIIKGTVKGYQRGINIVGHINQQPDSVKNSPYYTGETKPRGAEYPFYTHYYPYIKIEKGAKVYNTETGIADDGNGGIYGAGWCIIDIYGEVYGQTGLLLKGGDILVYDGTVYSTSTTGAADGKYKGSVSGNAIFITTDPSYAGNTGVTIDGDSKITGNGGTAITDVVAHSTTDPKVEHITINGGTIEGGAQGAIAVTEKTGDKTVVYGGGVTGTITKDGNAITTDSIAAPNTHTTTVVVGGKTTIVVSTGAAPKDLPNVYNTPVKDSVNWTGTTETLAGNLTLKELEINQTYAQVLIVPNGVTLNVEHLVMGENGKIIVEAGGKFVVDGEQGIIAPVTSNIVLQASADGYAQFLFNPAVTSNRHPKATIEWVSDSYRVDANNRYNQPFGIPTANKLESIVTDRTDHRVAFFRYNFSIDDWENIGYLNPEQPSQADLNVEELNNPFAYYQILCTSSTPGTKVTMKGELVGNDNQQLSYLAHYYMGFANSYTADIDLAAILPTIPGANEAVYIHQKVGDNQYYWEPSSTAYLTTTKIAPMQAFVILNRGAASSSTLNYKNMVWDTRAAAPKRAITDYNAQCRLSVSGQNAFDAVTMIEDARFTGAFDRGEAEKYMNTNVNIYVTDEQLMGIYATDELNNTYVGFSCKQGGIYTLSFDKLIGNDLALIDLTSNKVINIEEGIQYQFEATDNEINDYRFQIIKRQEVPTDLESVNNNIKANGIYTITGQYMGNMSVWNTLPAGVYVVDGQKKVK